MHFCKLETHLGAGGLHTVLGSVTGLVIFMPSMKNGSISCFDSVVDCLNRFKPWQAWLLIFFSFAAITAFDLSPYGRMFNIRSLYIITIVLACWMLRPRQAIAITVMVVATLFVKAPLSYGTPDFTSMVGSGIARTISYAILTIIVLSFRHVYDQVSAMAALDGMTGALNRSAFSKAAALRIDNARSTQSILLLAYLDLDGFKQVNDLGGHEAGDRILTAFARQAADEMRPGDLFGRLGGDEFAVTVQVKSRAQATMLAHRLHARMNDNLAQLECDVTLSMGALIVMPDDRRSYDELMREADRLMYVTKNGGKNRVTLCSDIVRSEEEPLSAAFPVGSAASLTA